MGDVDRIVTTVFANRSPLSKVKHIINLARSSNNIIKPWEVNSSASFYLDSRNKRPRFGVHISRNKCPAVKWQTSISLHVPCMMCLKPSYILIFGLKSARYSLTWLFRCLHQIVFDSRSHEPHMKLNNVRWFRILHQTNLKQNSLWMSFLWRIFFVAA